VDVHVRRLREQLEEQPDNPRYLTTVPLNTNANIMLYYANAKNLAAYGKIAPSGNSTRTTVSKAAPVITLSIIRRRILKGGMVTITGLELVSGNVPRRLAAGHAPHHQSRQCVHDDGDKE
jgi:hypothetical protein